MRSKRAFLLILTIALLSALALYLRIFVFSPSVCVRGRCLKVELAATPDELSEGLMFRKYLSSARGMLFIFSKDDFWPFWMKNTLIPLDVIWLDKDKKIVDMVVNAQPAVTDNPYSFKPVSPARYVLEANAGFVEKNKISVGDEARFDWIFLPGKI
ncbi:MAG: DUF192 domain-containing protein [Candidatus Omnitrophota bacterium]